MKLRNGNNSQKKYAAQIGVQGVEFAAEGPFKDGYDGSYLFNYRYSTMALIFPLLPEMKNSDELPVYQDLSFKFNLPTKKSGTFALWGIGGLSKSTMKGFDDVEKWNYPERRVNMNFHYNMKALVIIDIQNGLTEKKSLYKEKLFFDSINEAIKEYRDSDSKIIFVQHNNNQLKNGTTDWEIDERIIRYKNEIVIQKKHGNAFLKTNLKEVLLDSQINHITIGGLTSHGCVKATCIGGIAEGFKTSLLKNGHTNWNNDADTKILETEKELIKNGVLIESTTNLSTDTDSSKYLNNLTTSELGQLFPIIIKDYSDKWPDLYTSEEKLITDSFSQTEIVRIDHIGSTAIPGLKAKPTIDILLQITKQIDIQKLKDTFKSLGYLINDHPETPAPHLTFVKGYTKQGFKGQAYHVHIRYQGDWEEIGFRDYLIKHKAVAKEYETLKLKLAEKYPNDREAYTNSKTEWIEKINNLI